MSDTVSIEYIGKREYWKDNIYNTNTTYRKGKVYVLPVKIGKKLLLHRDTFRKVKADTDNSQKTQVVKTDTPKDESEDILDLHQKIDSMNNTASLRKFIKDKWGVETEKTAKLVELKTQAKQLTDQFGV
ncbi:MAG: hypothetical protein IKI11_09310 [Neisseriaceae bacterium]|nr:hypothetical protein [Neisseriaceae bacterium]